MLNKLKILTFGMATIKIFFWQIINAWEKNQFQDNRFDNKFLDILNVKIWLSFVELMFMQYPDSWPSSTKYILFSYNVGIPPGMLFLFIFLTITHTHIMFYLITFSAIWDHVRNPPSSWFA